MTGHGSGGDLLTDFRLDPDGALRGYVVEAERPDRRYVVEVLADGLPVALGRAIEYRADLVQGDGCYGFAFHLASGVLANAERVEARVANAATPFGRLARPFSVAPSVGPPPGPGAVRWPGGLTLAGWCAGGTPDPPPVVKALVDGFEVARVACRGWGEIAEAGIPRVGRTFTLRLPRRFADGRVHTVEVLTEGGEALEGSPRLVFGLPDGFADAIERDAEVESERVRARFADGLLPQALPFSAFEDWRARFPPPRPEPDHGTRFVVVIVGEGGLDATLASLEGQRGCDWRAAVLPSTESPVSFAPRALRDLLDAEAADCDLFVATVAGAVFRPGALGLLADAARRFPAAEAVYGDLGPGQGGGEPLGFPAFDEELFFEQGYCGLCYAMRPAAALAARGGADSLFALFPIPDQNGPGLAQGTPVHVPAALADLPGLPAEALRSALLASTTRRLAPSGIEVAVRAGPSAAVRVRRVPRAGAVSAVIAVRDDGAALTATLESLEATSGGVRLEILLADGCSSEPETLSVLAQAKGAGARVMTMDAWSSRARRLDAAAREARCEHVLFLDPGITAPEAGWLEELLSRAAASRFGAVGALLASRQGVVRHAGFVLGPRFGAVDRFRGCHGSEAGYAGWLAVAQEVSAVSAACLLTRRRDFEGVGGFDTLSFPSSHFDIDYCLRLRAADRRVLFTPDARLEQREGRGAPAEGAPPSPLLDREAGTLMERWALVPGCDPFYSPWMAMDGPTYSGLAWPPPPFEPRRPRFPERRSARGRSSEAR